MDRLISEQAVMDAINDTALYKYRYDLIERIKAIPPAEPKIVPIANIHFDEDKMREVCKEVAENLVVEYDFKGKTNGEVIKAVFPNFHTDEMSHTVWVGYDAMSFHRDWWDSPYDPQERSE